jgi:Glycosyltransferase
MHYKGADVLVDALYLLHDAGVNFSAAIAGGSLDPDYVKTLQDFCQEKGMADKVKFTGLLTKAQLKELYQASNVLVFPSRFQEPFGISQIEAMMAGLLLVTSGTGGSGEAIEDGISGLLFPSEDCYALAEILNYLAINPSEWQRIAIAGQKRALTYFTMERTVQELESLMRDMIALK